MESTVCPPKGQTFLSGIIYLDPAEPRQYQDVRLVSADGCSQMTNAAMLASVSRLLHDLLKDAWLEGSQIAISTEMTMQNLQLFSEFVSHGTISKPELDQEIVDNFASMGVNLNQLNFQHCQESKYRPAPSIPTEQIKVENVKLDDEPVTKDHVNGVHCKGSVLGVETEFEMLRKGANFLSLHCEEHNIRDRKHCFSEMKLVQLIAIHYISHHAKVLEPNLDTSRYSQGKFVNETDCAEIMLQPPGIAKIQIKADSKTRNKRSTQANNSSKSRSRNNQALQVLPIHDDRIQETEVKDEEPWMDDDWPSLEPECLIGSNSAEDGEADKEKEEETLINQVRKKRPKLSGKKKDSKCKHCSKSCQDRKELIAHIKECHPKQTPKCKHCSKSCENRKELVAHVKECHPKQPPKPSEKMVCPECGETLIGGQSVAYHMASFHSAKTHKCPQCPAMFGAEKLVKRHITRVHHTFICAECGQTVKRKYERAHRLKFHTPEDKKPFVCKTCVPVKGFVEKGHFDEHMNIHTGSKPFKCDSCPGVAYANKANLAAHIRSVHKGIKRKAN